VQRRHTTTTVSNTSDTEARALFFFFFLISANFFERLKHLADPQNAPSNFITILDKFS